MLRDNTFEFKERGLGDCRGLAAFDGFRGGERGGGGKGFLESRRRRRRRCGRLRLYLRLPMCSWSFFLLLFRRRRRRRRRRLATTPPALLRRQSLLTISHPKERPLQLPHRLLRKSGLGSFPFLWRHRTCQSL